MTAVERDAAIATEFHVEAKWDEQVGPAFSTSLDACFKLAADSGLPLSVYLKDDGVVYACANHMTKNYGKIPVAEAACISLMESRGFELVVKVL